MSSHPFPVDQRWHLGGPVSEWIKKEFSAGEYPEWFLGEEKGLALPLSQPGGQTLHETGAGRSHSTRLPRHHILSIHASAHDQASRARGSGLLSVVGLGVR